MGDSTSAASQEAQGDLSPSSHQQEAEETTSPSEQTTDAQADHVVSELVVKQVAPSPVITPRLEQGEPVKELRYANPHGTFITGIDVQSEVGSINHRNSRVDVYSAIALWVCRLLYTTDRSLRRSCLFLTYVHPYIHTGGSVEKVTEGRAIWFIKG